MAVATLATIDLHLPGGLFEGSGSLDEARTAGFTVPAQLFGAFNARSETRTAFARLLTNPWLWGSSAFSLLLQVAVVHAPLPRHGLFHRPVVGIAVADLRRNRQLGAAGRRAPQARAPHGRP